MTTHYRTDPDHLDRHATHLRTLSDHLSTAATRAPDTLGNQPLGAFAQFLTTGLQGAMAATTTAIAHAASTSDDLATGMAGTAADYRRAEDENAAAFTREGHP
ncbi:type VII secretion target [Actinokineospora sp. UTMC 2448]|uniref:type VII secretion target n=1 Tax=Actinokineospora sp. UTMC 2448 TaxID=2268449 RepID=UPI0021640DF6|nr:type VII secretion target [Actinokineospora sp. UTMC 2448]UVS78768.1 hypothetical protein Actkin_02504 [Actinokineospora sp. UTMC 2448]